MISPKVVLVRDVLEEHLDELPFLWQLRRDAVRSPERTRSDVDRLDERVRAHAEGLLAARGELGEIVGPLLSSDDTPAAFAAGFVLLRIGEEGARAVLDALRAAGPGGREGLAEALAFGETRYAREELVSLAGSDDPALAVAAAGALALGRGAAAPDVTRLLGETDPAVRVAAWRLVPFQARAPRTELLRRGLDDPDPDRMLTRALFLDTAQLSRIVMALPFVDANRVGATGGSQGGALTLAAASLDPRIKCLAPVYPFMCDYRRVWDMDLAADAYKELKDYFRRFDPQHRREEEVFTKLGYIDLQHLVSRIRGETLMCTGLMDTVCPPSTQFAAYNKIRAAKRFELWPDFGHENLPGVDDLIFRFMMEVLA